MKRFDFEIDVYDWDIIIIEIEGSKDRRKLRNFLIKNEIHIDDITFILNIISKDGLNGGTHLHNTYKRLTILIIYLQSDLEKKIGTICHEKRHTEDTILEHLGINDAEAAGYLAGYLGEKIFDRVLLVEK